MVRFEKRSKGGGKLKIRGRGGEGWEEEEEEEEEEEAQEEEEEEEVVHMHMTCFFLRNVLKMNTTHRRRKGLMAKLLTLDLELQMPPSIDSPASFWRKKKNMFTQSYVTQENNDLKFIPWFIS